MCKLLVTAFLLSLINHGTGLAMAWDDQDFFRYCPPSKCSKHGPEIRFPFRLEASNTSCGRPCMELVCSGKDTILVHPLLGPCKVIDIYYSHAVIKLVPLAALSPCPLQKLISKTIPIQVANEEHTHEALCDIYYEMYATLVCCSRELTPSIDAAGPISCLSNATHLSYLLPSYLPMTDLPLSCEVVSDGLVRLPCPRDVDWSRTTLNSLVERIIESAEMKLGWENLRECYDCEHKGGRCAFSSQRNQTFCMPRGSRIKVIAATSSVATLIVLLLIVATALYLSLKTNYNKEIHLKVEMFLKTYGTSKPTRYTFSEVKKIARRFKVKVGQGGFGSVYKGELPNGVPVAVKVLENSTGEGEVFINEVATIGLIHHANIVRLVGFCSEGTRRALLYEFMPNDSLEKYIFSHDSKVFQDLLVPEKMLDIALGIARGMEYLHQGCNQRILHFDIKPHNILLDYNFAPKISDFGLAKLCARDQSIVTLTAARGTMGYIAPELYSRNFGGVSYKSDVYSFGMLVLEMVSGRRNSDQGLDSQNEVYLPEWIYEKVTTGQDSVLTRELTEEEKVKMRQLAIVALWCIQWNPKNRPSMTNVVNMLTGRLRNLQIPPKPFVSSETYPVPQNMENTVP
ncbi:rust resistance kinase Lr10-like [Lolium perenne]|uniref:rust resistance kinase Lr10-like n=1 Tax=Lolium perenne TaxID=4522 RepID=UPI003A997A3B